MSIHVNEKNGKEIINKISIISKNNNCNMWIEFGTLLGYLRNGKFIKNDMDVDFGIKFEDW